MTPLKWHGGKHYLAPWIRSKMPPHKHYVEPFAGGLSVLLSGSGLDVSEVVNDTDRDLMCFWSVLRDPAGKDALMRRLAFTPFSEGEWNDAGDLLKTCDDPVIRAAAFFVRCRQSMSGRMACFSPLSRTRTRGGMNEQVSAWWGAIEGLPTIARRLARVVILCRESIDVIESQDGPGTLFYCDPPYLHSTRASTQVYAHEMSEAQHRLLLLSLNRCEGSVLLSGYRSDLYDSLLSGWERFEFEVANHAAKGEDKRRMTECLWRKVA